MVASLNSIHPFKREYQTWSRSDYSIKAVEGHYRIFTTAPFSFTGKHYSIRDFSLEPAPVQQPHPPILVGGGSPRVLALAAREADIVGLNIRTTADGGFDHASISAEATAQKVAWVKQAAGARLKDVEFSIYLLDVAVTDDRAGAVQQIVEKRSDVGFTHSQVLESPHIVVGSVEEIVAGLEHRRERYGISHIVISDDKIDEFAPIVEQLAGR